ncbi:phosphoribosylformylglycinamidine cyclo-ligase [Schnuerera sp.]|uniref:phosphoribosylformylglycinamidine cyclo-ligase n=1 Tax=Schnuerera sp. TaxID=2794844 RepID=UPI002BADB166|nr:phosphoribosylformylglycinamidine cyclo-ligase [Schnuerera sp.]HSH36763.1 phosphoribosylformylglycinamidine cyclo-ligase [Schnuerera sp.]
MKLTYKEAGVDKEAGYKGVQLIKNMIKNTHRDGVLSDIGGFAGLFQLDTKSYKEPVLVSGTDGVGTKLKIAFMMDKHNTIGEDCVAMCVNDILCQGAKPLFFLDYIATGKLVPEKMASIVEGVSNGCIKGEAALIGGETAEMPGFYKEDEYDLAGFCVGIVDKENIIDGSKVKEGDIILGLPSSGIHSNGYSLVRKIVFEKMDFEIDTIISELGITLGEELLKPTRIYTKTVFPLIGKYDIKGIVHITGGGFYENIPRIVPDNLTASIDTSKIKTPEIFNLLAKWGDISEKEMYSTFNMGIGMVLIVDKDEVEKIIASLREMDEEFTLLGKIEKGEEKVSLW